MSMVPLLRAVNAQIEAYLALHARGVESEPMLQLDEFVELQRCLNQIAPHLDELAAVRDAETQPEVLRYVHNLEQLRPVLLTTQQSLVARRDALRERRSHMQKVQAWANSYKEML